MLNPAQLAFLRTLGITVPGGADATGASAAPGQHMSPRTDAIGAAPERSRRASEPGEGGTSGLAQDSAQRVPLRITLYPDSASLGTGERQPFSATADYADGTSEVVTGQVEWTAAPAESLAIAASGEATAQDRTGVAKVKASLQGVSGEATVSVSSLDSIDIQPLRPRIFGGTTVPLKAWGRYGDGHSRELTTLVDWATSAPDVVAIDGHGQATAKRVNKGATLEISYVTSSGRTLHFATAAEVETPVLQSLKIGPEERWMVVSSQRQFKATGRYSDGREQDETKAMRWSAAPPDVLTVDDGVDKRGLATALKKQGSGRITVSDPNNPGLSVTITVDVLPPQQSEAPDPEQLRHQDQADAHEKGLADGKIGKQVHRAALVQKGEPGLGGRLAAYDVGFKEGRKAEGALAVDPRVEQLANETRVELAEDSIPEYWLLDDPGGYADIVRQYQAVREQLKDYLDNIDAKNATQQEMGKDLVKAWPQAIKQAGELRRRLGLSVSLIWDKPIKEEMAHLEVLRKELKTLQEKHKRIEEDIEKSERDSDIVSLVLQVGDAAEIVEAAAESVGKIGEEVTRAGLVLTGAKIVGKSQVIEKSIDNLLKYYSQITLVSEGFASMEELDRALERKVEDVDKSIKELARLTGHRERAQSNTSMGVMEDGGS